MEFSTLFYFLLSSIALTIMPGPDNLYLLAKSIADGSKQGVILAGGLASGIIFHTALVIFGVAAVIASTPEAFLMLKYLGAFYLFYLARQAYSAKPRPTNNVETKAKSKPNTANSNNSVTDTHNTATTSNSAKTNNTAPTGHAAKPYTASHVIKTSAASKIPTTSGFATYRKGLFMNILNPKVLLFFLAFLPQFVNPAGPAPAFQVALLGFIFSLQAFLIFSAIAISAGKLSHFLNQSEERQIIMNKIQGLILIIIGGLLLFF